MRTQSDIPVIRAIEEDDTALATPFLKCLIRLIHA